MHDLDAQPLQDAPPAMPAACAALPLTVAVDLQDHLMVAGNDLERLQRLLRDASDALMGHFYGATAQLRQLLHRVAAQPEAGSAELHQAMQHLAGAITAMQFQDMAAQLVDHTSRRLRDCADLLASEVMGDDEDGPAVIAGGPMRPNPVTQDEMDAGSVELF